jgi:hypothetical protein
LRHSFLSNQGSAAGDEMPLQREIVLRHPPRGELLLKHFPDPRPVERVRPPGSGGSCCLVGDDEARHAFIHDLRHRVVAHGENRGPAGHRLDHRQPERLTPSDWEYQSRGIAEELGFLVLGDLADEFDVGLRQKRFDFLLEVFPIDAVDLGRDLQPHTG